MFRNLATIEYRQPALDGVLRIGKVSDLPRAEDESQVQQRRLAAERAVDSVLADSFPASDPPSWTLGITRRQQEARGTPAETAVPDAGRPVRVKADVIDVSRPASDGRTFFKGFVSLSGAAGLALLVPFFILLIGMPIALAVRGGVEAASWLLALIFG